MTQAVTIISTTRLSKFRKSCSPIPLNGFPKPCAQNRVLSIPIKTPHFLHFPSHIHSHPLPFLLLPPLHFDFLCFPFSFSFRTSIFPFWQLWARQSNPPKPLHLPNRCEHQHQLHLHHLDPLASGKLLFHRVCLIHYFNFKYKILKRHALCYFLCLSILLIILCERI